MKVTLTWEDLLKLGGNGRLETPEYSIVVERPLLIHLTPYQGQQAVGFTLDDSDDFNNPGLKGLAITTKKDVQVTEGQTAFTVGDLRRHLQHFPDDYELAFGDGAAETPLTFYRTKQRGESLVQIEFNELIQQVTKL